MTDHDDHVEDMDTDRSNNIGESDSSSNNNNNNSQNVPLNLENLADLDRVIEEATRNVELPKSLIITNMDIRIFNESSELRSRFENACRELDPDVKFLYFKSFRRARLDFSTNYAATKARIVLNQLKFGDEAINCYFAEVTESNACDGDTEHLKPPALEKQFLISPPASPPEGWEPVEEAQPVLNIDLQSALANLLPGSTHELHPPTMDQPGIVVHICPNDSGLPAATLGDPKVAMTTKIAHTPCPPHLQRFQQQNQA